MNLHFNINYNTRYGEELALNIIAFNDDGSDKTIAMDTDEGSQWSCNVAVDKKLPETIDYYYSVMKNGCRARHEWMVSPHRLELDGSQTYHIYDNWTDLPDDAHLYSSAITECVAARSHTNTQAGQRPRHAVVLKVKAPQLAGNQKLVMVGNDSLLGEWNAAKGYPMAEHKPNEWMAVIDTDRLFAKNIEFKFVAADSESPLAYKWEWGDNRRMSIPALGAGETMVCELQQARLEAPAWRMAGTVIPVFSLRSEGSFGVGDFGDLRLMTDWAAQTGQRALQLLPINDTGITHTWTDSYPYNSISIYALHPQYTEAAAAARQRGKAQAL